METPFLLIHRGLERDWAFWLSRRADVAQHWVHPGVIQSVLTDERISVSGAGVAAAAGAEIVGGDVSDLYLSSEAVSRVIDDYGLQSDPAGQLLIHLWRPGSGAEYVLRPGKPVPVILAALDLLSAPDSRARHWANASIKQKMEGMPILLTKRHLSPSGVNRRRKISPVSLSNAHPTTERARRSSPTLVRSILTGASRTCGSTGPGPACPATHDHVRTRPQPSPHTA